MEEKMMDLLVQLAEGQKQLFEGQRQINERLDRIEARVDRIEAHVDQIEAHVNQMESHLAAVDARLDALEQRATKTEVILENRVMPQLQLLAEGHTVLAERLDRMDETYARKEDVEILQLAVQRHTEEIREIKAAM